MLLSEQEGEGIVTIDNTNQVARLILSLQCSRSSKLWRFSLLVQTHQQDIAVPTQWPSTQEQRDQAV